MNRLTNEVEAKQSQETIKMHIKMFGEAHPSLLRYVKLAEYEDLEEQGRLIKLPCKVGDFVFEANINRSIVSSYMITAIVIGKRSRNYNWELLDGIYSNINGFNEFALGKSVFLTREEAEKALGIENCTDEEKKK